MFRADSLSKEHCKIVSGINVPCRRATVANERHQHHTGPTRTFEADNAAYSPEKTASGDMMS